MARTASGRWCYVGVGIALVLLPFGIEWKYVSDEKVADFLVLGVGLVVGWLACFYCVGNHVALQD